MVFDFLGVISRRLLLYRAKKPLTSCRKLKDCKIILRQLIFFNVLFIVICIDLSIMYKGD
jgi:hypothetical protein